MMDNDNSVRADPDVLLSAISKKRSKKRGGRLYLFIGMAPGVGKTYSMLLAGREAQRSGTDIVVGVVESHGRKETEMLIDGLPVIPRKNVTHRGVDFLEMDIDAILARKPSIVLVDELAHTNIPGSRHAKRWQDVIELLDTGIDVYSTINVQHLESRKEAVERIAKITIAETVPDSILDRAFQIQLIDLSVPDLLRRLKEGKVYLGEKADLAAANFFKEEKLTALREIALRVAAERVDAELQSYITEREAGTSWQGAVDRLMVAVGVAKSAETIIRATRKMAYNLDASWIAVHVSTNEMFTDKKRTQLANNLALARNLGAEVVTVADTSVAEALVRIAAQKDVSQIVVGRSPKKFFRDLFGVGSLHDQLIARSTVDVFVVGPKPTEKAGIIDKLKAIRIRSTVRAFAKALLFTFGLIFLNAAIEPLIGYRAVGFLFLLGILTLGLFVPIGPVFVASIITMIGWNFFFIPPTGTFHITAPEDMFLALSYLVAALATGLLTRRNKYQQEILIEREQRAQALNQILLDIATESTTKGICGAVIKRVSNFLQGECDVVLLRRDRSLSSFVGQKLQVSNLNREMAVAKWAIENNKAAGHFTETLSSSEALYIPLKGSFDMMGALAFQAKKGHILSVEDMDFLFTAATQIAAGLEKHEFRKRALESDRLAESERVHQTLLELLVKEIRPTIGHKVPKGQLNFMLDNFLVLSRLFVGVFPLKRETCTLGSLVGKAVGKVKEAREQNDIPITIFGDRNEHVVRVECDLLVQALANVIMNAFEHSQSHAVTVEIKPHEIIVADEGRGIHEDDLGRIFEIFFRGDTTKKPGAGLGLAIAKGVFKAHQGKITAKNRPTGGLLVSMILPTEG